MLQFDLQLNYDYDILYIFCTELESEKTTNDFPCTPIVTTTTSAMVYIFIAYI